jgi:hypothetical protein
MLMIKPPRNKAFLKRPKGGVRRRPDDHAAKVVASGTKQRRTGKANIENLVMYPAIVSLVLNAHLE